ncbi:FAD-binding protein [Antrihabitans cavernicola]|uniref:FAD-binding protein n=1 Tax=Antrihabitans cavernicola TaxID=2495913 RepID=A0A5A7S975_9NOCA|nr:FAD-binding protein [Spelaeibacter cavernicola]
MTGEVKMNLPEKAEVVVVGAGPAGLTTACTLRGAGVDVLVLDAADRVTTQSRAAVIHARTLEVLESIDVSRRLVDEGVPVPIFTVRERSKTLARLDFGALDTAYPYALMLPQSRTEEILEARLGELGGYVHRSVAVRDVVASATGATVQTADGQSVTARYVVGSDGMHSVVRDAVGIDFVGGAYEQSFVLADVRMTWPLSRNEVQLFFAPAGLVVVAPLPGGRHRIVATMDDAPQNPSVADVAALMDERAPAGTHIDDVVWSSRFRVQHRIASTYRSGSILLAGDAAHVHSPAGGQGMNTGIQDAVDLGDTLNGVLTQQRPESTLDEYQTRRRPVAIKVVAMTDRMTRAATVRGAAPRVVRNTVVATAMRIPSVRTALATRIAELA